MSLRRVSYKRQAKCPPRSSQDPERTLALKFDKPASTNFQRTSFRFRQVQPERSSTHSWPKGPVRIMVMHDHELLVDRSALPGLMPAVALLCLRRSCFLTKSAAQSQFACRTLLDPGPTSSGALWESRRCSLPEGAHCGLVASICCVPSLTASLSRRQASSYMRSRSQPGPTCTLTIAAGAALVCLFVWLVV